MVSAGDVSGASGAPWVAVHDFTLGKSLTDSGLNGWRVAEKLENELVQIGRYRIVTRAKIAKVLKERNISSSGAMSPEKFGAIVGAEFIVTGQIDVNDDELIIIAKLIDVKNKTGEIKKSFDVSLFQTDGKQPIGLLGTGLNEIARLLTMTKGEFLDHGLAMMKQKDYFNAAKAFRELKRVTPIQRLEQILKASSSGGTPIPDIVVSPGETLDYALAELCTGNENGAATALRRLANFKTEDGARDFLKIEQMLKRAEINLAAQKETLRKAMEAAVDLLVKARKSRANIESGLPPEQLCDKALAKLERLSLDSKMRLNRSDKHVLNALIIRIRTFRKTIFAGPVKGNKWTIADLKMRFAPIQAGVFTMGDSNAEDGADNSVFEITISKAFWMSRGETTIAQFLHYLRSPEDKCPGLSRSEKEKHVSWLSDWCPIAKNHRMKRGKGMTWGDENQPVVGVSWIAADMFCRWLTSRERFAKRLPKGFVYRLPTEAEWEYCARSGGDSQYGFEKQGILSDYACFRDNSDNRTKAIGSKKANAWGLSDMHGNVWEWCGDWYAETYSGVKIDPVGPDASRDNLKVLRGGSFVSSPSDLRCAARYAFDYRRGKKNIGFRVVCAPEL